MSDMNTATSTPVHTDETLINLRKKATELAIQSENEELLALDGYYRKLNDMQAL